MLDYITLEEEQIDKIDRLNEDILYTHKMIGNKNYSLEKFKCRLILKDKKFKGKEIDVLYSYNSESRTILIEHDGRKCTFDLSTYRLVDPQNIKGDYYVDASCRNKKGLRFKVNKFDMGLLKLFFGINYLIESYNEDEIKVDVKVVGEKNEKHNKKKTTKNKTNTVRLYRCYTLDTNLEKHTKKNKFVYTCNAWGVRGHERHYKNGKVVWIKQYVKGKNRNDPSKYVGKNYKVLPG